MSRTGEDGVATPHRPAAPGRDVAVDVGRGLAILAIVLGHVLRGDAGAGLVSGSDPLFDELDTALYLWHLPVFALLSGLFVGPSVQRRGAGPYLRQRAVLFAWLYLVWTAVQGAVKLVTASAVNTPTTPVGILRELVLPTSQLWWLGFLFVVSVAAALARPWRGGWRLTGSALVAVAVSLAAWGHQGVVLGLQGLGVTAFFWAGAAGGARLRTWLRRLAVPLAVGGIVTAVLVCTLTDPMPPTSWDGGWAPLALVVGVVASVAATAAALGAAELLARTSLATALAFLGGRSLEIFLAHIVATAGARVVLLRLGVTDLPVHLVLGTVAGVAFPLALWWLGERLRLPWLFRLPPVLDRGR